MLALAVYLYVFIGMMRFFYLHQAERIEGNWGEYTWECALWPISVAADIEAWWLDSKSPES